MPSKRVRKPSQRAALAAVKVTKPTNNATRAAVTQGLIGAAARAQVYAAEPPEPPTELAVAAVAAVAAEPVETPDEPDVQEQGIEDPPPAYHLPEAFSYTLNWRVSDDSRGLDVTSDLLTQQSNMHAITVDKVKELNAAFEHDFPHFDVVSRRYKAGYSTMAEKNWQGTSHLSSFSVLMEQLLEAAPAEREELEASGNWSGEIIKLWTCTSGACGNEGKLCYWSVRNEAIYHYPIIRPVLLAWAEGLRNETLTKELPSVALYGQMVAAKPPLESSPRRRAAKETPVAQGQTIIYAGAPPPAPIIAAPATATLSSSPLRMPSGSPELSTIEKVEAFFTWCKTERCWRGEEVELDYVWLQVKEHGESVEGIGNAAVDEWLLLGIKIGHRKRLRVSAKKWMAAGMPVPGVVRVEIQR